MRCVGACQFSNADLATARIQWRRPAHDSHAALPQESTKQAYHSKAMSGWYATMLAMQASAPLPHPEAGPLMSNPHHVAVRPERPTITVPSTISAPPLTLPARLWCLSRCANTRMCMASVPLWRTRGIGTAGIITSTLTSNLRCSRTPSTWPMQHFERCAAMRSLLGWVAVSTSTSKGADAPTLVLSVIHL